MNDIIEDNKSAPHDSVVIGANHGGGASSDGCVGVVGNNSSVLTVKTDQVGGQQAPDFIQVHQGTRIEMQKGSALTLGADPLLFVAEFTEALGDGRTFTREQAIAACNHAALVAASRTMAEARSLPRKKVRFLRA